ncbi:MAG: hypothetical protein HY455_02360 [Parcubacteria group bacterium]|nr:hypothetical protein [Parcubacteria group bacterium]
MTPLQVIGFFPFFGSLGYLYFTGMPDFADSRATVTFAFVLAAGVVGSLMIAKVNEEKRASPRSFYVWVVFAALAIFIKEMFFSM